MSSPLKHDVEITVIKVSSSLLPLHAGQAAPLIRHRKTYELMADLVAGLR